MSGDPVNLRVPGPTPVPPSVVDAGARPMVNHRGPEFNALMRDLNAWLPPYFGTDAQVLMLTGSGTAGLEAVVVNMLSPGDEVLAVTVGVFGNRFADIAEAFGVTVHRLPFEWGTAAHPETVRAAVATRTNLRAVLLTHNETSTGVTNDIAALSAAVRAGSVAAEPLILVDGVSSIGALPFEMDAWQVDVAVTGSQKAWMTPPGLALVAVSDRGWHAYNEARLPRYYWDLGKARRDGLKGTTPATPAVGVIFALHEAVRLMNEEGADHIHARHAALGSQCRAGVLSVGMSVFAAPEVASDTVTAAQVPGGVAAPALIAALRRHGVVVGSGQDWLKDSIIRIGHMGYVHADDIDRVTGALSDVLRAGHLEEVG